MNEKWTVLHDASFKGPAEIVKLLKNEWMFSYENKCNEVNI